MLECYQIFVPKKRKYYIETLYSHYAHTHYAEQLDLTKEILKEKYPEYVNTFDAVVNRTYGYMFNMCIMSRQLMNEYCTWLFDILFTLKQKIGEDNLSSFQSRFYGRVSEIIFNVWLEQQVRDKKVEKDQIKELSYLYTEKINWKRKIVSFIEAKFIEKKYEESF